MLPPFIIDQIRKREEEQNPAHRDRPRPRVELPVPPPAEHQPLEDDADRGVVIIDL